MRKLRTPRILKVPSGWLIHYPYYPRMINLFGMVEPKRSKYIESCWAQELTDSWDKAIERLKKLYRNGDVSR